MRVCVLCFVGGGGVQLPEQVVGMATGSDITAAEKEAIARTVRDKRRLTAAAGEPDGFCRMKRKNRLFVCVFVGQPG